jgi:lysophospholipase L1-like esterase
MSDMTRRDILKSAATALPVVAAGLAAADVLGLTSQAAAAPSAKESAAPAAAKDQRPSVGADHRTYLQPVIQDLQKRWPNNALVNIVCHGHSVPAGYFNTPTVRTFDAYPHLVHVGLKERFPYAVINVIVTAIGGENSISGAARFDKDVLCHQPRVVTIDYATNDRDLELSKVRVAWTSMIESALAKNLKVLLLTPPIMTYMNPRLPAETRKPIFEKAQMIRDLAAKYNVGLVDATRAFEPHFAELYNYLSEPVHPNRAGHEVVAREMLEFFPIEPW